MKVQEIKEAGYEKVWEALDPSVKFHAFIALHSTQRGPALGGVRFWSYPSPQHALKDVLRLARNMTYKAAVADLPHGGGKGVLLEPPGAYDRGALMERFGEFIQSLGGVYITAKDVGTHSSDMALIKKRTPWVTGLPIAEGGAGSPSPLTAYGVLVGMRTAVRVALGKESLRGIRVSIQGLGGVGQDLAHRLAKEGAIIKGSDLSEKILQTLQKQISLHPVPPGEIYFQTAEIFSPCALGQVLHPQSIAELKAPIVAGAANDQLEDEERDSLLLQEKGILYAPDFVINAGGLIHVASELVGYEAPQAWAKAEKIGDTLEEIFSMANKKGISSYRAAMSLAESRLKH